MRAYRVFLEVRLLTRLARTPAARNAAELSKIVRVLTILRLGVVIAAQRARHRSVRPVSCGIRAFASPISLKVQWPRPGPGRRRTRRTTRRRVLEERPLRLRTP